MRFFLLPTLVGLLLLTGCGQKGPLYIPKPESPTTESGKENSFSAAP